MSRPVRTGAALVALLGANLAGFAWAGEADVVDATVERLPDGRVQVSATIRHADADWQHYADRFEVLDTGGNVIATRVLMHPHVDEQPFTRSTEPFRLPPNLERISVRAHDREHGCGGDVVEVRIPDPDKG